MCIRDRISALQAGIGQTGDFIIKNLIVFAPFQVIYDHSANLLFLKSELAFPNILVFQINWANTYKHQNAKT